jgi:predicted alpha/beta superfamily hydrolase
MGMLRIWDNDGMGIGIWDEDAIRRHEDTKTRRGYHGIYTHDTRNVNDTTRPSIYHSPPKPREEVFRRCGRCTGERARSDRAASMEELTESSRQAARQRACRVEELGQTQYYHNF